MNFEVYGRLRPDSASDRRTDVASVTVGTKYLEAEVASQTLTNKLYGDKVKFQKLFVSNDTNNVVFHSTLERLIDLFLEGFNTSYLVMGSKGAGKHYSVMGNSTTDGLQSILIDNIFKKLDREKQGQQLDSVTSRRSQSMPRLTVRAFDVNDDVITDLLPTISERSMQKLDIQESAENGTHVANLTEKPLTDSSAQYLLQQVWSRHTPESTGVVQLELKRTSADNSPLTRSTFTLFLIPLTVSMTQVSDDVVPAGTSLRQPRKPNPAYQQYTWLSQLVAALANQPYADRVIKYSSSALTRLLEEPLGGNCYTAVLMCFSPYEEPVSASQLFKFVECLQRVKNFPIVNYEQAQQLLTQMRARLNHARQLKDANADTLSNSLELELKNCKAENVILQDANDRLENKYIEYLELRKKYDALVSSKYDLSNQLLNTEQDKLRVSKTLVDEQIERNKLIEEHEAQKWEYERKISQLQVAVTEAEEHKNRLERSVERYQKQANEADVKLKEMTGEFDRHQSKIMELRAQLEREMERNDQLTMELLKLVNSQMSTLEQNEAAARERDRIKNFVSKLADRTEELQKLDEVRRSYDKPVFEAINRFQLRLDQERAEAEQERNKLQSKISELRAEVDDAKRMTREVQSELSAKNAQLIRTNGDNAALQSEVNKLQHRMKALNDEFRSKLATFIKDIGSYMDRRERRTAGDGVTPARMSQYIEEMLDDMKRAHRIREDQLSSAANSFKQRLEQIVKQHEVLLAVYSDLRQQVKLSGVTGLELGPDVEKLQLLGETDLKSNQQKQIEKLQDDLCRKQTELDALKLRLRVGNATKDIGDLINGVGDDMAETNSALKKQLQDFIQNTQQALEQERARLLSDNAMLKQEVSELQDYFDSHLVRYRDEILRLRQVIGQFKLASSLTAGNRQTPPPPATFTRRQY